MHVNASHARLQTDEKGVDVTILHLPLIGAEALWRIILESQSTPIYTSAITFYRNLYCNYDDYIGTLGDIFGKLLKCTRGDTATPAHNQQAERLLNLLESFIVKVEEDVSYLRQFPSHKHSYRGDDVHLHINALSSNRTFEVLTHTNEVFGLLRRTISQVVELPVLRYRLKSVGKALPLRLDCRRICQVNVSNEGIIAVRPTLNGSSLTGQSSYELSDPSREHRLPGYIISTHSNLMDLLFTLAENPSPTIRNLARSVLATVPSDKRFVQNYLDVCAGPYINEQDEVVDHSLDLREVCDIATVTPFMLLYHLEIIHSLMLPGFEDTAKFPYGEFQTRFVDKGGFEFLMSVFSAQFPDASMVETRSKCFQKAMVLIECLIAASSNQQQSDISIQILNEKVHQPVLKNKPVSFYPNYDSDSDDDHLAFPGVNRYAHVTPTKRSIVIKQQPRLISEGQTGGAVGGSLEKSISFNSNASFESQDSASPAVKGQDYQSFPIVSADSVAALVPILFNIVWASATGRINSLAVDSAAIAKLPKGDADAKSLELACDAMRVLRTVIALHPSLVSTIADDPNMESVVIDVLMSTNPLLRQEARSLFSTLAQSQVTGSKGRAVNRPYLIFTRILLKAKVPFWKLGGVSQLRRKSGSNNQANCLEYFGLLSDLLAIHCKVGDPQNTLPEFELTDMIENELRWFHELQASVEANESADALVIGHATLFRTLIKFPGTDKSEIGFSDSSALIPLFIEQYLFPESYLIYKAMSSPDGEGSIPIQPIMRQCHSDEAREAIFEVLAELADGSSQNLMLLASLIEKYHLNTKDFIGKWEIAVHGTGPTSHSFVGLKNAGATCYMNSVIQQLFMIPSLRTSIMSVSEDQAEPAQASATEPTQPSQSDNGSMFFNFQSIFGHLSDSKRQSYFPEVHYYN